MSQHLDIDADEQLLELVTDALREGPSSPRWGEALERIGRSSPAGDEYRILCGARERLESGRSYRTVRAGPGFRRQLNEGLAELERSGGRPSVSPASFIAAVSAAVILGVVAALLYLLSAPQAPADPVQELARTYFDREQIATRFDGQVPAGWRLIGSLPMEFSTSLRPAQPQDGAQPDEFQGGGIVCSAGLPAGEPFQLEVGLRLGQVHQDLIAQVFITEQPQFSADRATSPGELVWMAQGADPRVVLPDGRVQSQGLQLKPSPDPVHVRITLDGRVAIVECAGQRLWAGEHGLGDQPRYVGVRFLRRQGNAEAAFESIRLLKPR